MASLNLLMTRNLFAGVPVLKIPVYYVEDRRISEITFIAFEVEMVPLSSETAS